MGAVSLKKGRQFQYIQSSWKQSSRKFVKVVATRDGHLREIRPWDKLIESCRLQGILAKGLAFVVYTTFRWNNFNWDLFLLICLLDVNQPCPMLWYKPKFTQGVSPFIHQVLTTWSLLSRTYYSLLLLCTLGFNSSQFNFIHTLNWTGQRYDQLLLGKSWPCFFFIIICDSSSSWSCMRTYSPHPPSPHPGTPGTPI